jgi:hypothetical protein
MTTLHKACFGWLEQVLAVNAAKDATELVAKLCAYHHNAQTKADKQHLSGCVSNESRKMIPLCKLKVYSRLSENVAAVCMERPLSSIDTLSRF